MEYPNLFSPLEIRGHLYRNRIITGPTLFALTAFMTDIGENIYRMCENRAAGGAAEVITGELTIGNSGIPPVFGGRPELGVYEGRYFEGIREYSRRIKKHGAVALLEICHEGGQTADWDEAAMAQACDVFRRMAEYAMKAEFDGLLLHGAHGFLIQKFVSPYYNRRTDKFGGSLENRARFPLMLLDALREGLGDTGILELRLSAEDGEPGGMTIGDTVEFCRMIDGKADILHISNGQKMRPNRTHTFTSMYDAHGYNVPLAAQIKKAVKASKVAVIGGINGPEQAEKFIGEGAVDFVVLSRQSFADPDFANKAASGKSTLIRRCIRCFHCYPGMREHETERMPPLPPYKGNIFENLTGDPSYFSAADPLAAMLDALDKPEGVSPAAMGRCAINPKCNSKLYPELFPVPKASRKVLVVGGGVAGMQAAITARERGHNVTLVEKTAALGGTLQFVRSDPDKADLAGFIDTLENELALSGAVIRRNVSADASFIREFSPDYVLIAVGAGEKVPEVPGIENAVNVLTAYYHPEDLGARVIMLGGGLSACEAAIFLAGKGKQVTVVARRDKLAPESIGMQRTSMLDEMDRRGVRQLLSHQVTEVRKTGVLLFGPEAKELFIEADSVVFALGEEPRADDVAALGSACDTAGIPWKSIGDCTVPGKVANAIRAGYLGAMEIV